MGVVEHKLNVGIFVAGIHPDKGIRKLLKKAQRAGWEVSTDVGKSSHKWGDLICPNLAKNNNFWPCRNKGKCKRSIYSTAKGKQGFVDEVTNLITSCASFTEEEERKKKEKEESD